MPKVPKGYLDARRKEIVDAAMSCFARKGFHQTTMQDICKEAELSPGGIYRYFPSKNDIMTAVIERNTEWWTELIELAGQMAPEPDQTLALAGNYFFNRFHAPDFEETARVDIETWPETLRDPKLLATSRAQMQTLRTVLADLVRDRMAGLPDTEPEALINMYMAVYIGLQLNKMIDPEGVDTDAVLEILQAFQVDAAAPGGPEEPAVEPLPPRDVKAEENA